MIDLLQSQLREHHSSREFLSIGATVNLNGNQVVTRILISQQPRISVTHISFVQCIFGEVSPNLMHRPNANKQIDRTNHNKSATASNRFKSSHQSINHRITYIAMQWFIVCNSFVIKLNLTSSWLNYAIKCHHRMHSPYQAIIKI